MRTFRAPPAAALAGLAAAAAYSWLSMSALVTLYPCDRVGVAYIRHTSDSTALMAQGQRLQQLGMLCLIGLRTLLCDKCARANYTLFCVRRPAQSSECRIEVCTSAAYWMASTARRSGELTPHAVNSAARPQAMNSVATCRKSGKDKRIKDKGYDENLEIK